MALSKQSTYTSDVATTSLITPENSRKISMGASPKAMRFLIDRLTDMYPEPVESSVREVISNAIDATMLMPEADRKPIEILSPGTLNPVFVVTDHGVGMSVTDVEELFSQYGGSEKMEDFTQLGAYGLGAKAPLAYCNQFNVETTKDGITTRFTVSRESIGNTTEIYFSDRTDKPSGTTVSIPVKTGDEMKFDKALNNYRKFQADISITLDGKLVEQTLDYGFFDVVELDAETGLSGRVWVKNDRFKGLVSGYIVGSANPNIGFLLSGWIYRGSNQQYGTDHPDFLVELKPGVVDFSSSRDAITRNERYEELMKRLNEKLSVINEKLLLKVMDYFKNVSDKDAWAIFNRMSLTSDGEDITLEVTSRRSWNYSSSSPNVKSFKLKLEDFTTNTGFNPVKIAVEKKPKTVFGVVVLTGEGGADYSFDTVREGNNQANVYRDGRYLKTLTRFKDFPTWERYGRKTFAAVSTDIRDAVEGDETVSLVDLYFGTGEENRHGWRSSEPRVIVTGVDVALVDEFVKRRLPVARHAYPGRVLIFAKSAPPAKERERVTSVFGDEFVIITADEFREKMEEAHKIAIAKRKSATPEEREIAVQYSFVFDGDVKNIPGSVKSDRGAHCLISEIVAEGHVLIATNRSRPDRVIMGAINRGADLTGKRIYLLTDQNQWLAQHFNLLEDYENVFFEASFTSRSKTGKQIVERQRRDSSFLLSEVKSLNMSEIVHLYLSENFSLHGILPDFWKNLAVHTSDPMLKKIYKWCASAKMSPDYRNYYGTATELINTRIPEAEVRALDSVISELKHRDSPYEPSYTLDQRLYSCLPTAQKSDIEGENYKLLIEKYAKHLEEKISSDLAAESAQDSAASA